MPDPVPAPQPDTTKPKRTRGVVNKAHEEAVSKTEKVIAIRNNPAYKAVLEEREIDDPFVTGLSTDCSTARGFLGQVVDKTSDKTGATQAESDTKRALVKLTREVQAAAKQKHDGDANELRDYYVGQNIDQNRSTLEQAVAAILKKLETNTLPGIKPATVTALSDALKAYKDSDSTQSGKQSAASGTRISLEDLIEKINKGRRKILFAVEGAWPSDNPANAPIRREFDLPPNRPFVG